MTMPLKHAKIKGDPVLPFDNSSSDSIPQIELLTVAETAQILNISVTGVRRLQQARQLPFVKIGGSVRFSKSDLISYVENRRVESIDK